MSRYIEFQLYHSMGAKRPVTKMARAVLREIKVERITESVPDIETGLVEISLGPGTVFIEAGLGEMIHTYRRPARTKKPKKKAKKRRRK